jgi:hypothetical protein
MKKLLFISTLLLFSLLHVSCSINSISNNALPSNPVDVYVAGSKNGQACYWKNNQLIQLNSGTFIGTNATKIIISNNNVYVLGSTTNGNPTTYLYWKNGVLTNLNTSFSTSARTVLSIEDMEIVGNDVYFVGYTGPAMLTVIQPELTVWKNNLPTALNTSNQFGNFPSRIKVLNNTVYVSGKNNNGAATGYYVNSVFNPLLNSTPRGFTVNNNSIFTYGSQLMGGFYYDLINNVNTTINFASNGSVFNMCFDNNNVYYSSQTDIYKNGSLFSASPVGLNNLGDFKVLNDNLYKIINFGGVNFYQTTEINGVTTMTTSSGELFNSLFIVQN